MAQSRLEKIGTIYERVTSLIKAGALKEEARPLWVDIYKAFPPKYEPRFDRPKSSAPIRPIFYPEDKLRARFHKEYKHFSMVHLSNNNAISRTEQFLMIYKNLQKTGVPEAELYGKAVEEFVAKVNLKRVAEKETKPEPKTRTRPKDDKDQRTEVYQLLDQWTKEEGEQKLTELTEEEKQKYRPIRLSMEKIAEVMKKEDKKPE